MLSDRVKRIAFGSVLGAVAVCLPIVAPVFAAAQEIPILVGDKAISRQIKADEAHSYSFISPAETVITFQLEKNDLLLEINFSDAQQKHLRRITRRGFGATSFSFISAQTGLHYLEVRSLEKSTIGADYKLKIESRQSAEENDYVSIEIDERFTRAEDLQQRWSEAALRDALSIYREAAGISTAHKIRDKTIEADERIGEIYLVLGEYEESLAAFEQARRASIRARLLESELRQLCNLAAVNLLSGEYSEAAIRLSKVERDLRRFPFAAQADLPATLLNNLGEVAYFQGDLKAAGQFFDRALKQWQILGHRRGEAQTRQNLGFLHLDAGELNEAEKNLEHALLLWRDLSDLRGEAIALNSQGNLESLKNRWEAALNLHEKARAIFAFTGDKQGEAISANGIGAVYQYLNRPNEAANYYQRALEINIQLGNEGFAAVSYLVLGQVFQSRNKYPEAQKYFEEAIELCRRIDKPRIRFYALAGIAAIKAETGETAAALRIYRQTFSYYRQIGDLRGQASILRSIGDTYGKSGDAPSAERNYQAALGLNRQIGDEAGISDVLFRLAEIERDRENFAEALRLVEESIALSEGIRAKILNRTLRTAYQTTTHQRFGLKIDILMQTARRAPQRELMIKALETLEKSRARMLHELLTENLVEVRNAVEPDLLREEKELETLLRKRVEMQISLRGSTEPPALAEIENEITELTAEYERVQAKIKAQIPSYENLIQPKILDFAAIQSALEAEPDSIYLAYALGEPRSYLFAATRNALQTFELGEQGRLEASAREVYRLLAARQPQKAESPAEYQQRVGAADEQYYEAAQKLSDELFGRIAGQMKDKRLLISLEGALQYVPLEALPPPSQRAEPGGSENAEIANAPNEISQNSLLPFTPFSDSHSFLISQNEIVYLPSFSILAQLRQKNAAEPGDLKLAIWADAVYEADDPRIERKSSPQLPDESAINLPGVPKTDLPGASFPRLLNTNVEAQRIAGLLKAEKTSIFTDFAASRERVLTENLAGYRILHFAAHGLVNDSHPQYSGILLSRFDETGTAQNGLLSLEDVFRLELSEADLTVLSACQTGLGAELSGEGLFGLKHGFFHAGSKSVIVSLWQVDDNATAELMREFYSHFLTQGVSSSVALRRAKLEIMRRENWQAPYYWAAFTLHGEYRTTFPAKASTFNQKRFLINAGVILILIAGGLFLCRRIFPLWEKTR